MRVSLALLPLALLAACGGNASDGNVTGDPVANVAAPEGRSWTEVVTKTDAGGYLMGNPDAPIKLLEYGSRTCPTCGRFGVEGMEPLMENYVSTGKVSFEYRDFLVHPQDLGIALLGRCVAPERYFAMLEAMFAAQPELLPRAQELSQQQVARIQAQPGPQAAPLWAEALGYIDFVKQRGVPESQARACLGNQEMIDELANMLRFASQEMNVTGTPSFFLNGRPLDGVLGWEQLEPRLRAAGAR